MPQETKSFPEPDAGSTAHAQGGILEPHDEPSMRDALEVARDYRGDVEIELKDGTRLLGFVFDIDTKAGDGPAARMELPKDGGRRVVKSAEIKCIHLSGKDPAAGKSWENWVRRYAEKKLAGESASIESESLD
ncbi:MAG: hypothetical protein MK082_08450 [Phycisphaerales bacterium]|nr:hypothetical protein [Phycisphaerales bacterium]